MKRKFEAISAPPLPRVRWGKLLSQTVLWASAELTLGLVGADTLANYAEFLSESPAMAQVAEAFANLITNV